jgi:hypothetical protein
MGRPRKNGEIEPSGPEDEKAPQDAGGGAFDLNAEKRAASGEIQHRIRIHRTETETGDVDLIVNGHNLRIQREKEVVIAERYLHVLQNAISETFETKFEMRGGLEVAVTVPVVRRRFSYDYLGAVA